LAVCIEGSATLLAPAKRNKPQNIAGATQLRDWFENSELCRLHCQRRANPMREFFRGWKRKAGVVTLAMACVSVASWIVVHSNPKTRGTSFEIGMPEQTLVLTAMSAYLLLSKPRPAKNQSDNTPRTEPRSSACRNPLFSAQKLLQRANHPLPRIAGYLTI
jgi:hypothetical protein